jgi:hemoglobin
MAGTFGENVPLWQTILLEEHTQEVLSSHKQLPIAKEHFNRWMKFSLRQQTRLFAGATAEEAKLRVKNMAFN